MDPHPVILTVRDKSEYFRVLLYSSYTAHRVGGPPRVYETNQTFFWGVLRNSEKSGALCSSPLQYTRLPIAATHFCKPFVAVFVM